MGNLQNYGDIEKRWNLARSILSDHHGVWCAWCLEYILCPQDMELHHLLSPKDGIHTRFGLAPWVVPVHGEEVGQKHCHRKGLQDYAFSAGRSLLAASHFPAAKLETACKESFYRGNLPACLLLRSHAWREAVRRGDDEEARQNLMYALNAGAGCGLGKDFVEQVKETPYFQEDPDIRLYSAALAANAGEFGQARDTCAQLLREAPRVRRASSSTYSKLVRTRAIVKPALREAREAMAIARDSPDPHYHLRTSRLALSSAYERERNYTRARDEADELRLDFRIEPPSLWHEIGQLFLEGRVVFLSEDPPRVRLPALKALIRAQYASALLDFAGIPIPDFRTPSQEPELGRLTPTQAIHWIGGRLRLSAEDMTMVRRDAILSQSNPRPEDDAGPLGFQATVLHSLEVRDPTQRGST